MRPLLTIVTACNRPELLSRTLESLILNTDYKLDVRVHNDVERLGQNWNINQALSGIDGDYYLHLEDDWLFDDSNPYWVQDSIAILESDSSIIKVINRKDPVHPCEFEHHSFGFFNPWVDTWIGNTWYGFGWNCGVTRLDLIKPLLPVESWEQDFSKKVYDHNYKTALLKNSTAIHIGQNQSTHA